jgi:hypothetical protein
MGVVTQVEDGKKGRRPIDSWLWRRETLPFAQWEKHLSVMGEIRCNGNDALRSERLTMRGSNPRQPAQHTGRRTDQVLAGIPVAG